MKTVKEQVLEWIQSLPADCTLADIQDHLYVRDTLERSRKDIEEGRVIPQEEVERRMAEWLASSGQAQGQSNSRR